MSSGSFDLRRREAKARLATLAAVLVLPALPALGKGLLVSSNGIFAVVPAGGTLVRQITLTPTDLSPTLVRVRVEPFDVDADGRPEHGPGRRVSAQRVARVEAIPRRLLLENGHPEVLEVRCPSPEEGGSSWAVILLDLEPVRMRGQDGSLSDVTARVAVPVFVTVEGTQRPDLRIERISAVLVGPDRIAWEAQLENRGNTVLKFSGTFAVEEKGEELATRDLEDVLILPGFHRRIRGVVSGDFRVAKEISGRLWIRFGSRAGDVIQADCAVPASAETARVF